MNTMDPTGNPQTAGHGSAQRFGPLNPSAFLPYRHGEVIRAAMSVPDSISKCVFLGSHLKGEFVVRAPDGITAFTIHVGRWVTGPSRVSGAGGAALDGWLEISTLAVTGATDGELFRLTLDTLTDAVGCYLTDFTGSIAVSPAQFLMWVRGFPGLPG